MLPLIAQVALDIPLAQRFDYLAGECTAADIGCRVRVPFGKGERTGILVALSHDSAWPTDQLKPVTARLDAEALLTPDILTLLHFCSDYYHYPLGPTLFAALPVALRRGREARQQAPTHWRLSPLGQQQGLLLPARASSQRALHERLSANDGCVPENGLSPQERRLLATWRKQGWLEAASAAEPATGFVHTLNAEQQKAIANIDAAQGRFESFLLHGVTGSGKTEVYLRLTQRVIDRGGQVLLLVPEIHLTPQLGAAFRQRFGAERVATLHSSLSNAERMHQWLLAGKGSARIVLGTRLAVFTPMPDLQLILVDEEHDSGFHQQEGLRYAARDVAVVRAQQRGCPIVLGSATPALESWHNAQTGRYQRISLTQRATAMTLPAVRLIDTRVHKPVEGVSPPLDLALQHNLARGQQSLVFINRRGYAPTLYCRECGWAAGCARCSARLVVHLRDRSLRCHHCGHQETMTPACPNCGNVDLHPGGTGTQRLEHHLHMRFPAARILRVDRDSTQGEARWQTMQDAIRGGEIDLLIGTQLLSKGHDFPGLTLVGIIGADDALYSTDFRAPERLFAQLMQVGGRAGRAHWPGEVLIQTRFPDHPLFQALQTQDYAGYAQVLLDERRAAGFPPFVHQAALRADAPKLTDALDFLHQAQKLAPECRGVTLFDPTPEAMPRKANRERALLLVQSPQRALLQRYLSDWMPALLTLRGKQLRWHLDVDPQQL